MGLFGKSGKRTQVVQRRPVQRTSQHDYSQQERDLRYKAKNKLIGAIVLALIGVIVLPLVLSTEEPISTTTTQAPLIAPTGTQTSSGAASGGILISTAPGVSANTGSVAGTIEGKVIETLTIHSDSSSTEPPKSIAAATSQQSDSTQQSATQRTEVKTQTEQETKRVAEQKPEPKPEPKPTVAQTKPNTATDTAKSTITKRTDDGSEALALLEGRTPPSAAAKPATTATTKSAEPAAKKTSLSVQVAAYSQAEEARTQRDKLSNSGVSNAFVQSAVVNGRQTYRVRVGPFSSQEAAQAALTRLRGLGYSGFITGN